MQKEHSRHLHTHDKVRTNVGFSLDSISEFCTPCFPHHQPPTSVSAFLSPLPETYPRFAQMSWRAWSMTVLSMPAITDFSRKMFVVMTFLTHSLPLSPYCISFGCSYVMAYISCSLLVSLRLAEKLLRLLSHSRIHGHLRYKLRVVPCSRPVLSQFSLDNCSVQGSLQALMSPA